MDDNDDNKLTILKSLELATANLDLRLPHSKAFYESVDAAIAFLDTNFYKGICGKSDTTVTKSKQYRAASEQVRRSLRYAYIGRKLKKREFRSLWIARINAAARINGLSYSRLINGLMFTRARQRYAPQFW